MSAEVTTITVPKGTCACGCGNKPSAKSHFLPGHDQRLIGMLVTAARAGQELQISDGGGSLSNMSPQQYGNEVFSEHGRAKLERYLAAEPKRTRRARSDNHTNGDVSMGSVLRVKVGRWVKDARVHGMSQAGKVTAVAYTDANGVEKVTEKFAIV